MNKRWAPYQKTNTGFTIVELLIIVVVIGVLAGIVIVAYNGIQRAASESSIKSDLNGAAKAMGIVQVENDAYPDVMPATVKTSPGVTLELIKNTGGYTGLTNVQAGVLFHSICQQLINEGFGTGTNNGGGVERYITDCSIYNYNTIHINGWHSRHFPIPINSSAVSNWYNTNVTTDAWRPDKKNIIMEFASELDTRYQALGGSFPVSTFWDAWANETNGGVQFQPLGAPSTPSDPSNFCIQATHIKYPDILFHADQDGTPKQGGCS